MKKSVANGSYCNPSSMSWPACSQQQPNSQWHNLTNLDNYVNVQYIGATMLLIVPHILAVHGSQSDEIHGFADSLLHPPLDLLLLPLGEVSLGVAAGRAVVSHGQLVVVLAGSVSHQMGIVGRGWVGHGPCAA